MQGLTFEVADRVAPSAPERADVACFVGLGRRRPGAVLPAAQRSAVLDAGWGREPLQRVNVDDPSDPLLDVPLPFESYQAFAGLFDAAATYLGAAVRSFFAQGGRKCHVVVVRDVPPDGATRAQRLAALTWTPESAGLLPAPGEASANDRTTWHGAAHLYGLEDVSFLTLPDVPALVAVDPEPLPAVRLPPPSDPRFLECAEEAPEDENTWQPPPRTAPRCDEAGYEQWGDFLRRVADLLRQGGGHMREIHLVAAIPRPVPALDVGALPALPVDPRRIAAEEDMGRFLQQQGIFQRFESAFVQLAWPWARTAGSGGLAEGLEPLDGALAGTLARNALQRGTFRSADGLTVADITEVVPIPSRRDRALTLPGAPLRGLVERASLIGPTPRGLRVLSDVTSSPFEAHRQAPSSRVIAVLLRAARHAGLEHTFQPSGPATWQAVRRRMERLLLELFDAGALAGDTPEAAFTVRCDRTTMTQDDVDAGRVIATVEVQPAAALERIRVVLSLAEGGLAVEQGGEA
jgi:hypothetical protein